MTTVSSASGGARMSRHENANRLCREALPQRVRWSRIVTAAGLTPSAAAWRPISRSIAARARGLSHASRTAPIDRRSAGGDVDDDLVLLGAADPLDGRATQAGPRRHQAKSMELAPEADRRAVTQAAAGGDLGPVARLAREVAAQPRFAFAQEGVDVPLGVAPAAPPGRRHGHDDAALRVDRPRAGRATAVSGAACTPAARPASRATAGVSVTAVPGRQPWRPRGPPIGHERRSNRPARSPVSAPSRIAARPLTMTCWMPVG